MTGSTAISTARRSKQPTALLACALIVAFARPAAAQPARERLAAGWRFQMSDPAGTLEGLRYDAGPPGAV